MKLFPAIMLLAASAAMPALAKDVVYHVGPFDRLSQSGSVNIVYRSVPDSTGFACYRSDSNYDSALEIANNKGRLSVKEVQGHDLGPLPTLYVYSDYLSQVKSEGTALLTIDLSASTPTFSASLVGNGRIVCEGVNSTDVSASITTGNGTIALRGKCQEADFKLTGTGVIQADELTAQAVKCTVMGTGSIGCNAVKSLDVRGIGTTKIYYRGTPEIKKVGGARLSPLPDSSVTLDEAAEESDDEQPTIVTEDAAEDAAEEAVATVTETGTPVVDQAEEADDDEEDAEEEAETADE